MWSNNPRSNNPMIFLESHVIRDDQLNARNTLSSTAAIGLLSKAAIELVMQITNSGSMLTKSVSKILFSCPVNWRQTVHLEGRLHEVGETSVTVEIRMMRQDIQDDPTPVTSATFVFVLVDKLNRPVKISDEVHKKHAAFSRIARMEQLKQNRENESAFHHEDFVAR